jgi:hypothetical protein
MQRTFDWGLAIAVLGTMLCGLGLVLVDLHT